MDRQNEKTRHKAGFSGVSKTLLAVCGTLSGAAPGVVFDVNFMIFNEVSDSRSAFYL